MTIIIDTEFQIAIVDGTNISSLSELQNTVLALLQHSDHINGMDSIFDFRQTDFSFATNEIIETYANWLAPYTPRLARKVAVVVERDLEFGIIRMWNTKSEGISDQERMIFKDMDSARDWLLSSRSK